MASCWMKRNRFYEITPTVMQGNGETEKPTQHTDEEAVGSRWSKPEQQLGMSLRRHDWQPRSLPGVDNPFGRRMVRHYDAEVMPPPEIGAWGCSTGSGIISWKMS